MPAHSNQKIKRTVEDSKELVEKMNKLSGTLQQSLMDNFEKNLGVPLPTITEAAVRETDTVMVYATDPKVDEYINGARKIVSAALSQEATPIINGMLDVVEVVAKKIIGGGDIKTGIHSTAANIGGYVTTAMSVVQMASAEEWLTEANFFVSYYAFVVFKPTGNQRSMLLASPMLGATMAEPRAIPAAEIKDVAAKNYIYSSL